MRRRDPGLTLNIWAQANSEGLLRANPTSLSVPLTGFWEVASFGKTKLNPPGHPLKAIRHLSSVASENTGLMSQLSNGLFR